MIPFQIILSISSMVLQNSLSNSLSKKDFKTNNHINKFNLISYAVCVIFFGTLIINNKISYYTAFLGLLYGVVTALTYFYKMLALASGPMHTTLLIITSSMLIPTMSGIFFGEAFSIQKFILALILIGFIYLSLEKTNNAKINKRWLLFCLLAFIFGGSTGVLQKLHQVSMYKSEISGFGVVAFLCSFLYTGISSKKTFREIKFTPKQWAFAIINGLCICCMNILNLRLAGILPSQLFFPLVNGGSFVLSALISVFIFKENVSKKQIIGLCGGLICLIAICIVK